MTIKGTGIHTIGRRKTAIARIYVRPGSGTITVNGRDFDTYFGRETSKMIVKQPLHLLDSASRFDVLVNVVGGGLSSQAGAIRLALARALVVEDVAAKKPLRAQGYLTRDAREVERKKYGRHKARKRPQFSKR